jgi:hypothetical protein
VPSLRQRTFAPHLPTPPPARHALGEQTIKRKNLQALSKDDVIGIALVVWQHPTTAHYAPPQMLNGQRVSIENQSKSILLNVMQRGLRPPTSLSENDRTHSEPNIRNSVRNFRNSFRTMSLVSGGE